MAGITKPSTKDRLSQASSLVFVTQGGDRAAIQELLLAADEAVRLIGVYERAVSALKEIWP